MNSVLACGGEKKYGNYHKLKEQGDHLKGLCLGRLWLQGTGLLYLRMRMTVKGEEASEFGMWSEMLDF